MAITFEEIHEGRGGDNNGFSDNTDTRTWRVIGDVRAVSKFQIEQAGWSSGTLPIPHLSQHEEDPSLLCKRLSIRVKDDVGGGKIWQVQAFYDSKPVDKEKEEQQNQPDPLLRAAVYSGGFEKDQKPVSKDLDGALVENSAGDPFIDPVMKPRTRLRINGRQNVPPDAIPDWFYDLKDRINADPVDRGGHTYPEKTLLFSPGEISEPQKENGIDFIVIHWDLEYREETWTEKRIDNGFNQLVDNPNYQNGGPTEDQEKIKVPIEINGERPAEPQLLSDGLLIPQDEVEAGAFEELEFDIIETADFGVLP